MSVSYTRISNINEKVKDASLTISQWRVLFAINENTYVEEIGDYVEESIEQIQDSIQALINEGLVVSSEAAAPVEEKPVEVAEEPAIEADNVEEDIVIEDSEPEIVFADEQNDSELEEEASAEIEIGGDEEDIEIEFDEEVEFEEEPEEVIEDVDVSEEIQLDEEPEVFEEEIEPEPQEDVVESAEEPSEAEAETPASEATSTGDSKKIMVVDESIVIRKMVEIAFEDLNYAVVGYPSGEEALNSAEAENVDIYIVDSALKDIKSTSLMNQIKEKKSAPVIMFCTKTNPQLAKEVEEAGCDGIVSKPFNDDDLINKVNELT